MKDILGREIEPESLVDAALRLHAVLNREEASWGARKPSRSTQNAIEEARAMLERKEAAMTHDEVRKDASCS